MGNLYTGAMGMISFQNKLEVVGNNIANSRTNGYKKEMETFKVFEESFMKIMSNDTTGRIGNFQHQVHTDQVHTNMEQGSLVQTNGRYDFALQDTNEEATNFFMVEKNGEQLLTRDGGFQVDADRFLSMNDGSFVLDNQGARIQLPEGAVLSTNREGELVDQNTGQLIGEIGIRSIDHDNKALLEKTGTNKFRVMSQEDFVASYGPLENLLASYDNNIALRRLFPNRETVENIVAEGGINVLEQNGQFNLMTGVLEQSNVDLSKEMTEMMMAQRGFQASSKMLQVMDKINEKDANQIAM